MQTLYTIEVCCVSAMDSSVAAQPPRMSEEEKRREGRDADDALFWLPVHCLCGLRMIRQGSHQQKAFPLGGVPMFIAE